MEPVRKPGPTVAAHGEPIDMTSQADERRTSIARRDDGGHRWSPLATHMGYTRTPEQREAILAAIRSHDLDLDPAAPRVATSAHRSGRTHPSRGPDSRLHRCVARRSPRCNPATPSSASPTSPARVTT